MSQPSHLFRAEDLRTVLASKLREQRSQTASSSKEEIQVILKLSAYSTGLNSRFNFRRTKLLSKRRQSPKYPNLSLRLR